MKMELLGAFAEIVGTTNLNANIINKFIAEQTEFNLRDQTQILENLLATLVSEKLLNHRRENRLLGLIQGDIQGGKTKVLLILAALNYLQGQSTVIALRNMKSDELQAMSSALTLFNTINIDRPNITCVRDVNEAQIANALQANTQTPTIFFCLANVTQFNKVLNAIAAVNRNDAQTLNYSFIVDEIDVLYESEASRNVAQRSQSYRLITERAASVIGVTGTSFSVIFGENRLLTDNVYTLIPQENYVGINDIEWNIFEASLKATTAQRIGNSLEYLDTLYDQFPNGVRATRRDTGEEFIHPVICLLKVSRYTEVFDAIRTDSNENNWAAISYDGEAIKLKCNDNFLIDPAITVRPLHKDPVTVTRINGIFTFTNVEIGDVLEALRRITDIKRRIGDRIVMNHIAIASGELASRANRYGSNNYDNAINRWHLTHMLYLPTATNTCTDYIQALRVCGIFNDTLTPVVKTIQSVRDDILKAHNDIQTTIVNTCVGQPNTQSRCVSQVAREIPFRANQIPTAHTSKRKPTFNVILETLSDSEDDDDSDSEDENEDQFENGSTLYLVDERKAVRANISGQVYRNMIEVLTSKYETNPQKKWYFVSDIARSIVNRTGLTMRLTCVTTYKYVPNKSTEVTRITERGLYIQKIERENSLRWKVYYKV